MDEANPRDYKACSTELNQFEYDVYESLIEFLKRVSGINWHVEFSEGSRPDEEERNGAVQYGTVFIDTISDKVAKLERVSSMENEACMRYSKRVQARVTVKVYGVQELSPEAGQQFKTPADVLMRVREAWELIARVTDCTEANCIVMTDFGDIQNFQDVTQGSYRRYSQRDFSLEYRKNDSYPTELFSDDFMKKFTQKGGS